MSPYSVRDYNKRLWVSHRDRLVGGISSTELRTYTYPLYTPAGRSVLQEAPADHPHHHGLMVGQDCVNGHNFWLIQNRGAATNYQKVEATEQKLTAEAAEFTQSVAWLAATGQHVARERRITRFVATPEFHFVEVRSILSAEYGELYLGQTKEGGIGLRVHEQLETSLGGTIRSADGNVSEKKVFDTVADWVEVTGPVGGNPVGVALMLHPSQPRVPWFVRDYGLHLYSPRRHAPLRLAAGEKVDLRVGFAAYDGPPEQSQAARAFAWYRSQPA